MAYLGLQPDTSFRKLSKQTITGNGGATYTLDYPVNNASELEVYVNNVRQEPEVAYTVLNQTLTMTDNVLATDSFYVVYQGQAIGTLRIPEKDNSDNYNFDNGLLYLDAANNRVGIGITPSTKLHVYGEDTELRVQSSSNTSGFVRFINTSGSMSIGMSGAALNALLTYDRTNNHTVHQYLGGASGYHAWNTNGTERMRIDDAGNIGIGAASSGSLLEVTGFARSGGNATYRGDIAIVQKTNSITGIGGLEFKPDNAGSGHGVRLQNIFDGSSAYDFSIQSRSNAADWTERMRVYSNGDVGIGSTATNRFLISYNGTSGIATIGPNSTGGSTQLAFGTSSSGTYSTKMTIDSSGSVGIGTNSPGAKLHIDNAGTPALIMRNPVSSGYTSLRLYNDQNASNRSLEIDYYGSAHAGGERAEIAATGAYPLLFSTTNTERMRIASGGQIYVNVTSDIYGTPQFSTRRTTSGTNSCALLAANAFAGDVGEPAVFIMKYDNNSTTSQIYVKFIHSNGGLGSGQINGNGSGAAAFGSWSDIRLKENVVDLPPQLANILSLRPVEFDYIESEGGGHQIGFIAQEMEQVYPDAVGVRNDGMKTISSWSKTEARLVKAIQEQQEIIENLIARIETLEA